MMITHIYAAWRADLSGKFEPSFGQSDPLSSSSSSFSSFPTSSSSTSFSSPLFSQWPYCLRRCTYCNFNKYIARQNNDVIMTECLQRETGALLQLSQVSWYDSLSNPVCLFTAYQAPCILCLQLFNVDLSAQRHLSILWRGHTEPGSPFNHWSSLGIHLQEGEALGRCGGHPGGEPNPSGTVSVGGLLPRRGEPFLHRGPGEFSTRPDYILRQVAARNTFLSCRPCRMRIWEFWEETIVLFRPRGPSKRPGGSALGGSLWTWCLEGPDRALNRGRRSCPSCWECATTTCLCTSWPWSEGPSCSDRWRGERWACPMRKRPRRCTTVPAGLWAGTALCSTRCQTLRGTWVFQKCCKYQGNKYQSGTISWLHLKRGNDNSHVMFVLFFCFVWASQNALSCHNMSYWEGSQYIGVGPGISRTIAGLLWWLEKKVRFISVTGAHGRFVPVSEGGVTREARTQTLEPDVWILEVQQRGHGTRRRIKLGRLELWVVTPTRYSVLPCITCVHACVGVWIQPSCI